MTISNTSFKGLIYYIRFLRLLLFVIFSFCLSSGSGNAATYYVAPGGDQFNDGSIASPFANVSDITNRPDTVPPKLQAGDTIYVRSGTYDISVNIFNVNGTSNAPITISSYPGEWAVFDGSAYRPGEDAERFLIAADWYIIKNLEIINSPGYAIQLFKNPATLQAASNNRLENLKLHDNYLAGILLHEGASNNMIINCDSYRNYDFNTHGENADGFAANFDLGPGNQFINCRAWNNSDDGFDLYGATSPVLLKNCWSFENGVNVFGDIAFVGDGNGFKLGQPGPGAQHQVYNNLAWNNMLHGFDYNGSTIPLTIYNNTAYNNGNGIYHNYRFEQAAHVLRNNLSYQGTVRILSPADALYNSWNIPPGITVGNSDFISLNDSSNKGNRQPDGNLPVSNFLKLSSGSDLIDAGTNVGLPYIGKAPDLGAYETTATAKGIVPMYEILLKK